VALMVAVHLGRPTWFWIVLPAVAFGLSLWADVAQYRRGSA
jgi:hypothetical protein